MNSRDIIRAVIFLLLQFCVAFSTESYIAQKGVLDFSLTPFDTTSVKAIKGDFLFYPNQLQVSDTTPVDTVQIPHVWPKGTQYGTYQLKLIHLPESQRVSIFLPEVFSSARVSINNQSISQVGTPDSTKKGTVPHISPQWILLPPNMGDTVTLQLSIANFYHFRSGLPYQLKIGTLTQVEIETNNDKLLDMFMAGMCIIFSLYHLLLFILNPQQKKLIFFSLFAATHAVRISVTDSTMILNFLHLSWLTVMHLRFTSVILSSILFLFLINSLIKNSIPKKVLLSLGIFHTLYLLRALFSASQVLTDIRVWGVITLSSIIYILYRLIRKAQKGNKDALIISIAIVIVFLTGIHDYLYYQNITVLIPGYFLHWGYILLILSQAIILAQQENRAFKTIGLMHKKVKKQALELKQTNTDLLNEMSIRQDKEKQLIQMQKMEAVNNLAGGLAHDFNNLLGGIIGAASYVKFSIEDNSIENEEIVEHLGLIEETGDRAAALVKQLLMLSREQEIVQKTVDLTGTINNVVSLCKSSFDKSIEVVVQNDNQETYVYADPYQVEQVLLNICINASHAMTIMRDPQVPIGGKLTITLRMCNATECNVTTQSDTDYWCISIEDTGIGMDESTQKKIFDPFFTTKAEGTGTGLGLAMAYNIITQHKGTIAINSKVGKGTIFRINLPVYHVTHKQSAHQEIISSKLYGTEKILVIDDDPVLQQTARLILSKYGYTPIVADHGREGIAEFENQKDTIAVVILDLSMPKMSGKEVFQKLMKIKKECKVIIVSGYKDDPRITWILHHGGKKAIQKPYSMQHLLEALREVIDSE